MISKQRAVEIQQYWNDHGTTETKHRYNINEETLTRYVRHARFDEQKQSKILILDIETSLMLVNVWGLYKQRISHENIIDDWYCISWVAKWLHSPDVYEGVLTPEEAVSGNDKRIMAGIWELMNDANVVIAHNGIRFDFRKLNARFLLNGFPPPSSYRELDSLKEAQKRFGLSSHRLDYLGRLKRDKGKIPTDFGLWKRCMAGDKSALTEMVTYNKEDVLLLEEIYLWIRPYIKSHPNMGVITEAKFPVCSTCGSSNIKETNGFYLTSANKYQEYRCEDCGSLSHHSKSNLTREDREALLRPNAR